MFSEGDVEGIVRSVFEEELFVVDDLVKFQAGKDDCWTFEKWNCNFLVGIDIDYRMVDFASCPNPP